jgi:hypothetical protein
MTWLLPLLFFSTGNFDLLYLGVILTTGITSFIVLAITNYGPNHFSNFLPQLQTIAAELESRQKAILQEESLKM